MVGLAICDDMNKRKTITTEKENYGKYHIPNCQAYMKRQKNCVVIHTSNNLPHEMKKAELCYYIQKAGHKFITEAQRNSSKFIVDVVDITTGQEYEIVDTHGDIER
jgi:hypothetical protein